MKGITEDRKETQAKFPFSLVLFVAIVVFLVFEMRQRRNQIVAPKRDSLLIDSMRTIEISILLKERRWQ